MRISLLPFLLLPILIGCENRNPIYIDIDTYSSRKASPKTSESRLDIYSKNGFIYYRYKELSLPDSVFDYLVGQKKGTIDSIAYFKTMIPLVGVDTFSFNGKSIIVSKYEYNLEDAYDEEMEVFLVPNHGLILLKSVAWGLFETFSSPEPWSGKIIAHILSDTSGFYFNPPILMPSIRHLIENEEILKILDDDSEDWEDLENLESGD